MVSLNTLIAGARAGKLVSFPTDTVPALATIPEQAGLIFAAKQRSQDKPLILMAASAAELLSFVVGSELENQIWQEVAQKYWPGSLTLVLPANSRVPKALNPNEPTTIGLRVPNSAIALEILAQTGPLATTSANLSGQPPLQTMREIEAQFPNVLTLTVTESQMKNVSIPSTVAKWSGNNWQILRQGTVAIASSIKE